MASSIDFESTVDPELLELYNLLLTEEFTGNDDFNTDQCLPKNPTNDTSEFSNWIDYGPCSPSAAGSYSPSATTDTLSSYDSSASPLSYSSPPINRSQSPTELGQNVSMLNFDGELISSQPSWEEDLSFDGEPISSQHSWDEGMDMDKWSSDLSQYTPILPLSRTTTPPVSPSPSPSGTAYSPQSSPSPSPSKTSIGPIRRRKRAARSPDAPKNYPCTFPGCTISCLRRCDLTKHSKRHVKPFSCRVCNLRFSTVKDCERHDLSKHQKEKHLRCSYCSHSTARKDNLADHVRRKHS